MTDGVATRSDTVTKMINDSQRVHDLMAGGVHMRAKGVTYLPKFPAEDTTDYDARKASTWLFNGVKKVREDITGRVFEKPVVLKDQKGRLFDYCQNVDLEGRDLSNFAKDVFEASLERGISFIMADAPPRNEQMTVGQVKASGWRPYLVGLKLDQVLGWKSELVGGAPTLTQFRIMESVADPDRTEYSDDTIEQVRELSLVEGRVRVRLWRGGTSGDGSWAIFQEYDTDLDQIYVVPVYTGRTGYFTAKTPLDEIAELNLAHWRVQSDKSSCLHKALAPMLFMKSMLDETGAPVVSSAGMAFNTSSPDGDLKWVEVSGAGIEKASVELGEIQDQMQQMGLQLISDRVGVTTATGESINEGKSVTRIRMWADDLKDSLEIALGWMVDIMGDAGVDTEVIVNKDYGVLGNMPLSDIKDMYLAGVISRETYIKEAQRRGALAEDVDPSDEIETQERGSLDDER